MGLSDFGEAARLLQQVVFYFFPSESLFLFANDLG